MRRGLWKERKGFGWLWLGLCKERKDFVSGEWDHPGRAPRPCGHEDLSRILQPQVVGASGAAQQASVRKQQQAGRSSRACVHCRMHAGEVRVK